MKISYDYFFAHPPCAKKNTPKNNNDSTTSCPESGPSSSQLEGHKHHDDASISGIGQDASHHLG